MSAPGRGLGWLAHAVAAVWLGAYLAWTELEFRSVDPLTPEPAANEAAKPVKVSARPERAEPDPPRRAPPPRPLPKAAVRAADPPTDPTYTTHPPKAPATARGVAQRIGPAELAAGKRLLDGGASFPVLSAGYREFRSFRNYARAMAALGARFVVLRDREIVASAYIEDGDFGSVAAVGDFGGFSPRARSYSDEPGLAPLLRRARERFGRDASVAMLVPRGLDAGLFGGIARALGALGESTESFHEIRGRYEPGPGGTAQFRVESALRKDGARVSLDLIFDLRQITLAEAAQDAA